VKHLREVIRLKPGYAGAHYRLAEELAKKGNIAEAVRHYAETLKIEPDHPRAAAKLKEILRRYGAAARPQGAAE